MSTANTTPQTSVQQLIEQRLDAIDQALLGILPRDDRRAAVAQVETRIREVAAGGTPPLPSQSPLFALPLGGQIPATPKRRSRLAISAGVLGILALALLFAIPVTYTAIEVMGDVLGEFISYSLLGVHTVAVAIGGVAAIGLGIAALVSLRRHREHLVGHGWAIVGLCTGPLPTLLGCAAVLFLGLQLGVMQVFTSSSPCVADSSTTSESPKKWDGQNWVDADSPNAPVTSNGNIPVGYYSSGTAEQLPQAMSCQPPVCYAPGQPAMSCQPPVCYAPHPQSTPSPSPICHAGDELCVAPTQPFVVETSGPVAPPATTEVRLVAAGAGEPPAGEQHYRIGVQLAEADETLRSQLRLAAGEGLVVTEVVPDSPAASAGLRKNDVLTKLDGKRLTKIEAVNGQIQEIKDRKVSVSLFRAGSEITCDVTPKLATEASFTFTLTGSLDGLIRLQEAEHGTLQVVVDVSSEPQVQEAARPTAAEQLVILKNQLAEVHKSLAALEAALQAAPEEKK